MYIDFNGKKIDIGRHAIALGIAAVVTLSLLAVYLAWPRGTASGVTAVQPLPSTAAPRQETSKEACERRGGLQVDGVCKPREEVGGETNKEKCERYGGVQELGVCKPREVPVAKGTCETRGGVVVNGICQPR
jgi:hypothetical protein